MIKFLRDLFGGNSETEEEFRARMLGLVTLEADLLTKRPDEILGDHLEPIYYGLKALDALRNGDHSNARGFLCEMLRADPCDSMLRLLAASIYVQVGEEAEATAQLGIALAINPSNYAAHLQLARRLAKHGDLKAARSVLESGWIHHRKALPKSEQKTGRVKYFAIVDGQQAI